MSRATTQSKIEKRGLRLLRRIEECPRFKHSRQAKALIEAIQYGDSDLAIWFLKRGFDPEARDSKGRSALWWAAAWRRPSVIRALVQRGATLPDGVLMGPVRAGDERIVRLLVQRGANVNCVASDYSPVPQQHIKQVLLTVALGTAALDRRLESIPIMLIRAGAQVNRLILPKPFPGHGCLSMIGLAAHSGLLKTVKAMIAAGADVNFRDGFGRSALFYALSQGHLSVAKELLRAGAKTDVTDHAGLTPLEAVRKQERSAAMEFTEVLIGAGVEVGKDRLDRERAAWRRQRARMLVLLEGHSTNRQ